MYVVYSEQGSHVAGTAVAALACAALALHSVTSEASAVWLTTAGSADE